MPIRPFVDRSVARMRRPIIARPPCPPRRPPTRSAGGGGAAGRLVLVEGRMWAQRVLLDVERAVRAEGRAVGPERTRCRAGGARGPPPSPPRPCRPRCRSPRPGPAAPTAMPSDGALAPHGSTARDGSASDGDASAAGAVGTRCSASPSIAREVGRSPAGPTVTGSSPERGGVIVRSSARFASGEPSIVASRSGGGKAGSPSITRRAAPVAGSSATKAGRASPTRSSSAGSTITAGPRLVGREVPKGRVRPRHDRPDPDPRGERVLHAVPADELRLGLGAHVEHPDGAVARGRDADHRRRAGRVVGSVGRGGPVLGREGPQLAVRHHLTHPQHRAVERPARHDDAALRRPGDVVGPGAGDPAPVRWTRSC